MHQFRSVARWLDRQDWPLFKWISPATKKRWLRRVGSWLPSDYGREVVQVDDLSLAMPMSKWDQAAFVEMQQPIAQCLKRLLRPGMRVVDVGANIGYFTVISAKLVGPSGSVYALEPFPDSMAVLERNIELNALANVRVLRSAAGAQPEKRLLYLHEYSTLNSLYADQSKPITGKTLEVEVVRLDDVVQPPIDLVKVDVEGAELEVLAGFTDVLTGSRPPILIVEWSLVWQQRAGHGAGALPKRLIELGYRLYNLAGTEELMRDANGVETTVERLRATSYPALDLLALPPHAIQGHHAHQSVHERS